MIFTKTLVIGLISVSLCMSNISGKVTDISGISPITGAVVRLENGGQTATTGADGRFTLVVGGIGILSGNGKLPPNGLFARISGNMVTLTMAKKSTVEIAAFDFSGKLVFTTCKPLEAGNQSIALPQRSTGIYLYKLKAEDREFVLKGYAFNGISFVRSAIAQRSSSKSLLKQAKATAVTSDVITATKEGKLNYRCVIGNSDTSGIVIKMIANAGNVADTDGNVYQSVQIGNQVWTVENLRTTKYNDGSMIPFDTSTTTWFGAKIPGRRTAT